MHIVTAGSDQHWIIVATPARVMKIAGPLVGSHFVVSDPPKVISPFTTKVLAPLAYDRSAVLYRCEEMSHFNGHLLSIYKQKSKPAYLWGAPKVVSMPRDKMSIHVRTDANTGIREKFPAE